MRIGIPAFAAHAVVLAAALVTCGETSAADESRDAAVSFYRSYSSLRATGGLSGIPNESQLARLAPLITPELRDLFGAALREQERCAKQFPGDKPPWIEGDIFSSNFEGFTSFSSASSKPGEQRREVAMRFSYADGKQRVNWTDTLFLRNEAGRWLVDDIFYRGHFAFTSGFGKNLKSSLKSIPAC
jgi:hypothetical protein